MKYDESNEVLNSLIQINNDRLEGYETAAEETKEEELKNFFMSLIKTSHKCIEELSAEVTKQGGTPTESTRMTGKFFRVWMDVKAALAGNDRKAILESCEYGEEQAQETYEDALEDEMEILTSTQLTMINTQYHALKADYEKVKAMVPA